MQCSSGCGLLWRMHDRHALHDEARDAALAWVSTCVCVGDKGGRTRCSRRTSEISVGAACLLHEENEGAEPRRRQELLLREEIGHVHTWEFGNASVGTDADGRELRLVGVLDLADLGSGLVRRTPRCRTASLCNPECYITSLSSISCYQKCRTSVHLGFSC
jgi:hypothetical protein